MLAALVRIFAEALADHYRAWGREHAGAPCESGAITFVQRFGSSLNLNVHFHVIVLDGVFVREPDARITFHAAPRPCPDELARVLERMHRRTLAWLTRHGHVESSPLQACSNEAPARTPLDACADLAMRRGTIEVDERRDLGQRHRADRARSRGSRARRCDRGGLLLATAPRVPWSILLRRTFDVDVLECAKCHGRLRVLGTIEDPAAARAILERLGFPADAPAQVRARDPTLLHGDDHAEEMAAEEMAG